MALFNKWRKTSQVSLTTIVAPITGTIIPLKKVPDTILANKIIGDGIAIEPTGTELIAPCDGVIYRIAPSGHAFSISTSHDEELLIHFGLDTVQLKGEGFTALVKAGDSVQAGQPIIELDLDRIRQKAKSLITTVLVSSQPHKLHFDVVADETVTAGQSVIFTIES